MAAERPRQEADGSTDASGKEFSCRDCGKGYNSSKGLLQHYRRESNTCVGEECPTCGKSYTSKHGVKSHHKKDHGERLGGILIECDYCGDEVRKRPCRLKRVENSFCGGECRDAYIRENGVLAGENNPQYKEPVKTSCDYCGDNIERPPSHISNKNFCSKSCYNTFLRESDSFSGENHPNWSGGYTNWYGANWDSQRKKAVIRDQSRCQDCGVSALTLGKELHVHHIRPLKDFKNEYQEPTWWERGNRLRNLVTLCPECHRKWEGIPLRPQ